MAYTNFNTHFAANTEVITGRLLRRSINTSIWNKLVVKETFERGKGVSQRVITAGRNLPSDTDTWEDVPTSGDSQCVPTEYTVGHGYDEALFSMQQKALVSLPICVDATYGADNITQQAAAMLRNLEQVVAYVWKRKAIQAYIDVSTNLFVAAAGLPRNEASWPAQPATSKLTQDMLDVFYDSLIGDSAAMDGGSLGMAHGQPQFILAIGAQASNRIMRETGSDNINAFLYNKDRVPELLQPLGVDRIIRGFYHSIDSLPPRYTYANGVYTEVAPYVAVAASGSGTKLRIRQAYREAPYEAAFVYLPTVLSFAVPQPVSTIGSKTQWNPQSYIGELQWLNIPNRTDNPLGMIGQYYALLRCAVKPGIPEFGYGIIFKRCPADINVTGCSDTGSDATSSLLGEGDSYYVADE